MNLSKRIALLIISITLLAGFLRIYKIAEIPPALSWDEVSIGYNAYSILKTGRDEHQKFLPVDTFVAYGDYKPPLAVYITVPFVAMFGLNELAVRLPSAFFGTFTVLLTYFFVRSLFRAEDSEIRVRSKSKNLASTSMGWQASLALISTLILAISPWHINLSRAGFEANIALFLVLLGIYLFL
jgi:4-amino-4-deoxy-L-arabinose transferase-like glycosyltransferase